MKSWLRHLHELPEGARFMVEGDAGPESDAQGEWRVVEQNPASVRVAPVVPKRETRTITPRFGEPVEITVEAFGWRRMAPTTQVIQCAAGVALVLHAAKTTTIPTIQES